MSLPKNIESEDPIWQMHMQMLMKRKKNMEIARIIDESLYKYYTKQLGLPVPNWKRQRNPDWWIQYLIELGIDPSNP